MAHRNDLTGIGLFAAAPLVFGAAIMWTAPFIVPEWVALNVHTVLLAYAGIVASFIAGAGAASALDAGAAPRATPYLAAALFAWFAIWPAGLLYFSVPAVWRYLILIIVFAWLGLRSAGASSGYGAIPPRMIFWICISLILIMARLAFWRHY